MTDMSIKSYLKLSSSPLLSKFNNDSKAAAFSTTISSHSDPRYSSNPSTLHITYHHNARCLVIPFLLPMTEEFLHSICSMFVMNKKKKAIFVLAGSQDSILGWHIKVIVYYWHAEVSVVKVHLNCFAIF